MVLMRPLRSSIDDKLATCGYCDFLHTLDHSMSGIGDGGNITAESSGRWLGFARQATRAARPDGRQSHQGPLNGPTRAPKAKPLSPRSAPSAIWVLLQLYSLSNAMRLSKKYGLYDDWDVLVMMARLESAVAIDRRR